MPTRCRRITSSDIRLPPERQLSDPNLRYGAGAGPPAGRATGTPLTPNERFPEYHGADLASGFGLLVQRLGDGPARIHLDIHTDDLAAEVARLERLGAQRLGRLEFWQVMRDPAGLVFCVVEAPPGQLTGANAHRWG